MLAMPTLDASTALLTKSCRLLELPFFRVHLSSLDIQVLQEIVERAGCAKLGEEKNKETKKKGGLQIPGGLSCRGWNTFVPSCSTSGFDSWFLIPGSPHDPALTGINPWYNSLVTSIYLF